RDGGLAALARDFASNVIGQASHGDAEQPAARVRRDAFGGPARGRGDERILQRVFRGREIVMTTSERGEHLRPRIPQQAPDRAVDRATLHSNTTRAVTTWLYC